MPLFIRRVAAALALVVIAALTTLIPSSLMSAADASCSAITVSGTLQVGGSVKPRWGVAIALHNAATPLTGGRADAHGHFAIGVCRTSAVRNYAARHGGHVNLDVLAHAYDRRSALVIRTVAPRLGARRVTIRERFIAMAAKSQIVAARRTSGGGSRIIQTGDPAMDAVKATPPVMYLENVPGITTTYSLDSSDMKSVATTVGVSVGGYGISGSIEIAKDYGFFYDGIVTRPKGVSQMAVLVRPEVLVTMTYTCRSEYVMAPYIGGQYFTSCTHAMDAGWTGAVDTPRARYTPCSQGVWDVHFINNRSTHHLGVHEGATFTAKGGIKTPWVEADVSTTYGAGTSFTYELNQSKALHRFCISGNATTLADSSQIYITPKYATVALPKCMAMAPMRRPC